MGGVFFVSSLIQLKKGTQFWVIKGSKFHMSEVNKMKKMGSTWQTFFYFMYFSPKLHILASCGKKWYFDHHLPHGSQYRAFSDWKWKNAWNKKMSHRASPLRWYQFFFYFQSGKASKWQKTTSETMVKVAFMFSCAGREWAYMQWEENY